jgi:hypothetical protein
MWAAGVVLALSTTGIGACLTRGWWWLTPAGSSLQLWLESGCLGINNIRPAVLPDGTRGTEVMVMDDPYWYWPGDTGFVEASDGLWGLVVPLWIPAAASGGLLLAMTLANARKRRRDMVGLCRTCGYDLTGIDAVCPECGTKP